MSRADALTSLLSYPVCTNPFQIGQVGIQFRHMNSCYSGSYPICICIELNFHVHITHFSASGYGTGFMYIQRRKIGKDVCIEPEIQLNVCWINPAI